MKKQSLHRSVVLNLIIVLICVACRQIEAAPSTKASPTTEPKLACGTTLMRYQNPKLVTGVVLLCVAIEKDDDDAYLDLDQGITRDRSKADVLIRANGGSAIFPTLLPTNGAIAAPIQNKGASGVDKSSCEHEKSRLSKGNIPEITAGSFICVLTSEGHVSLLHIQRSMLKENFQLEFAFTTWQ
jgi:hypothetical protein